MWRLREGGGDAGEGDGGRDGFRSQNVGVCYCVVLSNYKIHMNYIYE